MAANRYYLMRKNDIICLVALDEQGNMVGQAKEMRNPELAPLAYRYKPTWLREWWADRSIPIGQGQIMDILKERGYSVPQKKD